MNWLQKSTPAGLVVLAILVGIGGAIGATFFHFLIHLSILGFYGYGGSGGFLSTLETIPIWQRVLIPTIGGLLVGIIFKLAKVAEAEGEGVPEVMEAISYHKGTIRPVVAPVKIITAAITLGSGGSAGREGPVIQIGSTIGSSIGQYFKLKTHEKRVLLAAGAAAAIGGTFGAPLAGVLFTYEILKTKLGYFNVIYIGIAAIVGYVGTHFLTNGQQLRFTSSITFEAETMNIITLLLISCGSAITALAFGKTLSITKGAFQKIHAPHVLKPALGGFVIGLIGISIPHIHEPAAYPLMVDILSFTVIPASFLLVLLIIKMLTTGITIGSGGSGGIFAPLLLTGAILGTLVSSLTGVDTSGIFVISGMAAVFAAAAHAPLTAAVICFEITQAPLFSLPIFIGTSFLAAYIAKSINPVSVYSLPSEEDATNKRYE